MKYFFKGQIAIGIFLGICLILCFEFFVDFFGKSIEPSETLVATIFGAAIALTGTILAILSSAEENEEERRRVDETKILVIFAKLTDTLDKFTKIYRYYWTDDKTLKLSLTNERGEIILLHKPLHGNFPHAVFTPDEKALSLRLRKDWLFNALNDIEGADKLIDYLSGMHLDSFNKVSTLGLSSKNASVHDRQVSSTVELKKTDIMMAQEAEAHLKNVVVTSLPKVAEVHKKINAMIKEEFSISIEMDNEKESAGHLDSGL